MGNSSVSLTPDSTDLVGVSTKQKMPYGSSDSFCSTGSTNAAVFPLPVFAQPMQSWPETETHLHLPALSSDSLTYCPEVATEDIVGNNIVDIHKILTH